ncbi:MAG: glycosyltransferase [Terrimicrobiaceae bacterium]
MKALIISHPCATATNQAVFAGVRRITGWDLQLVVPARWRDEFGNSLGQADDPELEGRVIKVPVIFNGNIILHCYRMGWSSFLRRGNYDVIYMHHEPYALATGQVCLANSRQRNPAAFGFYSAQNIFKTYPPPFSWVENFVHRSSRFCFPVSRTVADVLAAKKTRALCTVCPLPVDPAIYFPRDTGSGVQLKEANEVIIGYVGRLVESKGLATLAAALARIPHLAWKLHVVGTGEFRGAFEQLLKEGNILDRVTFHGFIPHLKTPEYLSAMDLLVVPSETRPNWKEQFGRVIVEAMACGTPVLGSDSGEIPVLIQSGGGGIVFPEANAPALAECLSRMIESPALRYELAERGRVWVSETATLEVVARRMAGAMEQASRERKR